MAAKRKPGRPNKYTKVLARKVCMLISEGVSIRKIAAMPTMPSKTTIFKWLAEIDEFTDLYAKAKEEAADAMVEEMLEIADEDAQTELVIEGVPVIDPETNEPYKIVTSAGVAHARLRVDTRKWISSKLKPKKYGEKVELEHKGKIQHDGKWEVEFVNADPKLKEGKNGP